jgi:copper/silver efflux system protein
VIAKVGRVDSALDPAPIGMVETFVSLTPRSEWRPGITVPDILAELKKVTAQPGVAPSWLQPIETRVVMLQSGIKASIALKVYGEDPNSLETFCTQAEQIIRNVPGTADVAAQRLSGKLYLEYNLDRRRLSHYGIKLEAAQNVIQVALGGMPITTTVEGRERFTIRARYPRAERADVDDLGRLLVPTSEGAQIPISYVADIKYRPGPAAILTEDLFVYSYVSFNARGRDEVGVVNDCQRAIANAIADGSLVPPPDLARYEFGGRYKYQQRANARLAILIPAALMINLFLVFLHFRSLSVSLLVFTGIPLAFAGGFIFLSVWPGLEQILYQIDPTGSFPIPLGQPVYLTVAVWVGFIALFGIAIEDGVVIATYITQLIRRHKPASVEALRATIQEAGMRRIRPAMMTTVTTLLALSPVLWASGRGSDVMKPMALPLFGGMLFQTISVFVVPCVFALVMERRLKRGLPLLPDPDEPDPGETHEPGEHVTPETS